MNEARDPMAGDWKSWILLGDYEYVSKQEAEARLAKVEPLMERYKFLILNSGEAQAERELIELRRRLAEAEADAEWLYAELAGVAHASAYLADNPDCSACQALAAHEKRKEGVRE